MSVRGGRGTSRLWVAAALLLFLAPLFPLPADAQSSSDPWWGPSDRAKPTEGWAVRVPVVVHNTYDHALVDAFVPAEIDLAKLLVAAGWTNQTSGAATVPRGFTLDVDSIRVVPYTRGFTAGPIAGASTTPIPHRFYPAMFEESRYRPFDASRAAGTVLFQIEGTLAPDEKRYFYIYANPTEFRDTPPLDVDPVLLSPLESFMWGTRGTVYYGYQPQQEGQAHRILVRPTAGRATVTVSTYELGRYVPIPTTATLTNPFEVFGTTPREVYVPAGKVFRVSADAPIIVTGRGDLIENQIPNQAGYLPGRSGGFADDAFDVFGLQNSQNGASQVRLIKAGPGTITVQSSLASETLTSLNPVVNIRIPYNQWSTLTGNGKFLVSLQSRVEQPSDDNGIPFMPHQVPAVTGGPAGEQFYTFLHSEKGYALLCPDGPAAVRIIDQDSGGQIQIYPEGTLPNVAPKLLPGRACERAMMPITTATNHLYEVRSTDENPASNGTAAQLRLVVGTDTRTRDNGEINHTRPMIGQFYGGPGGVDYWVQGDTGIFGHYNGTRLTITEERLRDGRLNYTDRTLGLERDGYIALIPSGESTGRFRIQGTKPFAVQSLAPASRLETDSGNQDQYAINSPYFRNIPGRPIPLTIDVGKLEFRGPLVELRNPGKGGSGDFLTTGPGSPASYRLDVVNLGRWTGNTDLTDTITLACTPPPGWTLEGCNKDVTLRSGSSERLDVVVTPSEDDVDELIPIEITARSKAGGAVATFTLRVKVSIVYGVGMWFDVEGGRKTIDPPIGLDPGAAHRYDLVVKNTGSTTDTILLTADEPEDGWSQEILDAGVAVQSVRLEGGESRVLEFVVTAPSTESARPNIVSIVGQSQSSATAADIVNTATRIKPKVDLDVVLTPQTQLAAPNETAAFDLTLCNKGNDIFTIYLTQDSILPKGWNATFSTERIGNELTLNRNPGCADPAQNVTVQLFVTPPPGARAGDLASAKIAAEIDTGGAGGRVAGDEVSAVVVVRRIYNLTAPPIADAAATPGRDLRLVLPVQNLGNGQVSIELLQGAVEAALLRADGTEQIVPDWRVALESAGLTLGLNDTAELVLRVDIPRATPPGLYNLTFTTRLSREAVQNLTIPVDVRAIARVELLGEERISFAAGRPVSVPFVAENTGNVEGAFDLAATAPDGWNVTLSPARVRLAPGDRVNVLATVNATREAPDGAYRVVLSSAAEGHAPTTRDLTVSIARPQIQITDVSSTGAMRPGELVLVTATISNLGGIAADNISVAMIVDDRVVDKVTLSRIPIGSSALATLSWVSTQRGGDVRVVVDPDQEIVLAERGEDATEATVKFGSFLGTPGPGIGLVVGALVAAVALRRRWAF